MERPQAFGGLGSVDHRDLSLRYLWRLLSRVNSAMCVLYHMELRHPYGGAYLITCGRNHS